MELPARPGTGLVLVEPGLVLVDELFETSVLLPGELRTRAAAVLAALTRLLNGEGMPRAIYMRVRWVNCAARGRPALNLGAELGKMPASQQVLWIVTCSLLRTFCPFLDAELVMSIMSIM